MLLFKQNQSPPLSVFTTLRSKIFSLPTVKDFGRDENEVEEDEEVDEVSKVPVSNCCSKN